MWNENPSKFVRDVFSKVVDQNFGMSKKEDNNMDCKHRPMDCTIAHKRYKGIINNQMQKTSLGFL